MALGAALTAFSGAAAAATPEPPAFAQRGLPGPGQAALQPLVGTWRVEKASYIAAGTRERPATSDQLICRREWIANGRFLRDETQGTMGGAPYYRLGLLGYSNEDGRYEWVTADALNANMMIYLGEPGSGPARKGQPISVAGSFTDQGLIDETTAGRSVRQRTVIRIENPDRHVVELYFTPPGGEEFLADRAVYSRSS